MTGSHRLKIAAGECRLRVYETNTRDAIVTDTEPCRTIAYVAIGAETWGPLLAAAPILLEFLREAVELVPESQDTEIWLENARAAIAKTETSQSAKGGVT